MFWHIALFEIRFWLRSWMLWIFFLVIGTLIFFATASPDHITVGVSLSNTHYNAPFVIQNFYSIVSFLTLLMSTAFVNSAAARDFSFNTFQIVFSTPLRRRDFLLGRFVGATLVSVIPMLGVSVGILAAKFAPWVDQERWGAVDWIAHLRGIYVFALPNAFFMAAVLFSIAVLARNEIMSFVGALLLLVGYGVTAALIPDAVTYGKVASLLDPFAITTFGLFTRYWTVADMNTHSVGLDGLMLWNRIIWVTVGAIVFLVSAMRFSFAEKKTSFRPEPAESPVASPAAGTAFPPFHLDDSSWQRFLSSVKIHFLGMAKSVFFVVIMALSLLNCVPALMLNATEGYGNSSLPVTYSIIRIISGTLYFFLLIIITYCAGVLVWKDRDQHMDEITDSLPTSEWVSYASRLVTLVGMVILIQLAAMAAGIAVQAFHHYYRFQFWLYAGQMLYRDGTLFLFLAVLAFFIHVLSPNKYIGYFLYIVFVAANALAWGAVNVSAYLLRYGSRPTVTYSDFYQDLPFRSALNWYTLYWLIFCGLLAIATSMFWPRGRQDSFGDRLRNAGMRFTGGWKAATAVCLLAFMAVGGWLFYNTKVINAYVGPKDLERRQADYEKAYAQFDKLPQPRPRSVDYKIDIDPETRNVVMQTAEVIYNPYSQPLSEVHFSLDFNYDTTIEIPGASLSKDDRKLFYRIYHFDSPLQPGESRTMHYTVRSHTRGFENEVSVTQLVQNGTFFNSSVGPLIGYDRQREMTDPVLRKKYGLPESNLMPALERNCTDDCRETYLRGHSDWVDAHTVISTSPDQLAIAPGSLVREWQAGGRRYFEYQLDHPALNFHSFMSARYEVAREDWNGIQLEVYYDRDHPWNVPRMMNSLKKSLDYFIKNFGPYANKEARIIEFPRVARFAQAFAGTMPYSEAIGFIANLNHPDDIDMVFYVVAHEMGHQWWAHQVVGADMEGATLLSETMAQYSALMVMEKEYGRDTMRKFLRYEMDNYLQSRGRERLKERPLQNVEASQGYIHYRKGSVAIYYLKEMIGEDAVNRALRKVVRKYGYGEPPYPTSYVLTDALREETPPNLQYLIKDLFEDITIFSNRTTEASAKKRDDGKYDVTIEVEAHKYKADAKGAETETPLDDWIDIGAFAKPAKGKKYGETLYRDRIHMTQNKSKYTFTTAQLPEKAGIDPFMLLIDRIPDDNTMDVELARK